MSAPIISAAERAAAPVARAALESQASAYGPADAIVFALGSAQLLRSPEEAAEVARLRERLAELEPFEALHPQECENGQHLGWFVDSEQVHACPWCRIAELEASIRPARVYRAEHDGIPLGTYRTRPAARGHIETLLSVESAGAHRWASDDESDPEAAEEALLVPYDGAHIPTGYTVTPVPVDDVYDPEAEG